MGDWKASPLCPRCSRFAESFRVYKRAHKTCDTVCAARGRRRMADAVHLETRCNGCAHGGCQAECLMFWKQAWLKKVDGAIPLEVVADLALCSTSGAQCGCTESDVENGTLATNQGVPIDQVFVCQNTQIPYATTELQWWDVRQYIEDYTSGNATLQQLVNAAVYSCYYYVSMAGIGVGRCMRWFYERFHWLWGGTTWPRYSGKIPVTESTPSHILNLQPGELVRVKSHKEILATVNMENRNRGLSRDCEMVPYCGKVYRVLKRISRLIDERTGRLVETKNPCIVLDTVVCQGRYSPCRLLCPRAIYPYWREIWLERVSESAPGISVRDSQCAGRESPAKESVS